MRRSASRARSSFSSRSRRSRSRSAASAVSTTSRRRVLSIEIPSIAAGLPFSPSVTLPRSTIQWTAPSGRMIRYSIRSGPAWPEYSSSREATRARSSGCASSSSSSRETEARPPASVGAPAGSGHRPKLRNICADQIMRPVSRFHSQVPMPPASCARRKCSSAVRVLSGGAVPVERRKPPIAFAIPVPCRTIRSGSTWRGRAKPRSPRPSRCETNAAMR